MEWLILILLGYLKMFLQLEVKSQQVNPMLYCLSYSICYLFYCIESFVCIAIVIFYDNLIQLVRIVVIKYLENLSKKFAKQVFNIAVYQNYEVDDNYLTVLLTTLYLISSSIT